MNTPTNTNNHMHIDTPMYSSINPNTYVHTPMYTNIHTDILKHKKYKTLHYEIVRLIYWYSRIARLNNNMFIHQYNKNMPTY